MNRIATLFEEKKENILSVYFTAGFPEVHNTTIILNGLVDAGVDMIEIGFPFSDPLADGPVIQSSSKKAIENGMSLVRLFKQLKDVRDLTQIPILLMGYLNPILQYGEEAFIDKCAEVGIDGVIIPDMPLDYYQNNLQQNFKKNNLYNILLITPETTQERIQLIDDNSDGFIYMVSTNSITGNTNRSNFNVEYFKRINKMNLKNPRLTGFGIHDNETYTMACQYSSGAIVGSAFIKYINDNGSSPASIQQFINQIRP